MTLELFLNLAWLGMAIGAISLFALWARSADSGRRRLSVGLSLICVLALLFPIISVSDDMRTDTAALEEWTSARRSALIISIANVAVPVVAAMQQTSKDVLVCIGLVSLTILPLATRAFASARSLRAPPSPRC